MNVDSDHDCRNLVTQLEHLAEGLSQNLPGISITVHAQMDMSILSVHDLLQPTFTTIASWKLLQLAYS